MTKPNRERPKGPTDCPVCGGEFEPESLRYCSTDRAWLCPRCDRNWHRTAHGDCGTNAERATERLWPKETSTDG